MKTSPSFFQKILSAFFPDRCSVCGEVTYMGKVVCESCAERVFPISGHICHRCGVGSDEHGVSSCEELAAPVIAAFYYRDSVRNLIIDFKDTLRKEYFDVFSLDFFEKIAVEYSNVDFDIAVCVPTGSSGKGTSAVICKETAKRFLIPYDIFVLEKYRETQKQHRISVELRRTNLINSIRVRSDREAVVSGKTVLLLDDVKTTGATLNECSKALLACGAKAVYCACIAVSDYNTTK